MKSWEYIIKCIEKLETLSNGSGSEIEFEYNGDEYGIVSYGDHCEFMKEGVSEYKTFATLEELGKSDCFGFKLEEVWVDLKELAIRPDFLNDEFELIYQSYEKVADTQKYNKMNYKNLIDHVLGNARIYLKDYSKKATLTDYEKGILHGMWMDVDSINNQLETEILDGNCPQKAKELKEELKLEELMKAMENLFRKR